MPEKSTIEKAREDAREGKAPTTQAGEFIREEIEHIREGKHGARSTKQAIAIAQTPHLKHTPLRGELLARAGGYPPAVPSKSAVDERGRRQKT